jgi:hypothetical protein
MEDVQELLSSNYFISDENWPGDFHLTLGIGRDLETSIRVEMPTASEMAMPKPYWTYCNYQPRMICFGFSSGKGEILPSEHSATTIHSEKFEFRNVGHYLASCPASCDNDIHGIRRD